MNKIFGCTILFIFLMSCMGKYSSDAPAAVIDESVRGANDVEGDTMAIDVARSVIHWKGTKMRGAGKHEGVIHLANATLLSKDDQLTGGAFTIDMNSIEVTDIPLDDPIPRRNLTNHLKSDDFFDVAQYPTAQFMIIQVLPVSGDSLQIKGNLTIRDITHAIAFGAVKDDRVFSAHFTFDRFLWNIAYKGNWVDRTLVDKDVVLNISLALK